MRTPIIYILLLIAIIVLATSFDSLTGTTPDELEYNAFLDKVKSDDLGAIVIVQNDVVGIYKTSDILKEQLPERYDFSVHIPSEYTLTHDLAIIYAEKLDKPVESISSLDYAFDYNSKAPAEESWLLSLLPYLLLTGALIFFYYMMVQQQQGGNKMMSFGKSHARTQTDKRNAVTFADVAGADEEKEELKEIVDFMREPKRFQEMGARIPKGVLLVGPPGTGKTLLAKAVAGEADVPFFSISGSDFVEMFVGVGASRVRDLFATAKKSTPAVVFIDEIDAVGRQRGAGLGGGHDEREQTLNQLLVEMDGFTVNEGIIIIAATNRPDILDPALLRPGRFDRQITVHYPDVRGREEILRVHAKGKPLAETVDLSVLAKRTPGFTGADLENVLNEAALLAARNKKSVITMIELEEAITRVVVGPEKKSRVITERDKRITAYHEAGHAIIALMLEGCDPVHEVSIIPRGMAGGYTMTLPKEDMQYTTKAKLLDEIAMLLGGRVAEMIKLGDVSTGAHNDLQRATEIARRMVTEYGMSEELGLVSFGSNQEVFIAKDWGHQRNYSEAVAGKVDAVIRSILDNGSVRAEKIIREHDDGINRVVAALLDRERLDGEEFARVFRGDQTTPPSDEPPKTE
jgi:cell division protease FtsH